MHYSIAYDEIEEYLYNFTKLKIDESGNIYADSKECLHNSMYIIYLTCVSPLFIAKDGETYDMIYKSIIQEIDYNNINKTIIKDIKEKHDLLDSVGMCMEDYKDFI